MITKVANSKDIKELKNKTKALLKTQAGVDLFNQRYGRDFSYQELSKLITSRKAIWVAHLDEALIGFAELWHKDDGLAELGYTIFPEYQKKGFGYQLAKVAFDDCRNKLKITRLKIEVENNNIGSISIVNKLAQTFPVSVTEINEEYDTPTNIFKWYF